MIRFCLGGVVELLAVLFLLLLPSRPFFAQTTTTQPLFTLQGPAEPTGLPVIRDALGRPCLDIEAASRAHVVNKALYDQIVSIKNRCTRLIRAKVCYYNSDNCKSVDVGSYQRQDIVLGSVMNGVSFRYSLIQK